MRMILAFLASFIFASAATHAQKTNPTQPSVVASTQAITQPPESPELQAAKHQIKLLESQLTMTRDFQTAILDTVYWALGGVFVLLGLLLGFGWFVNFKVYDRDKQALQTDLDGRIRTALQVLNSDFATKAANLEGDHNTKLEEFTRSMGYIEERLAKSIETSIRSNMSALESAIAKLQRESLHRTIAAEMHPEAAFSTARQLLYLTRDKAPHEIPDVLAMMLRILEKGCRLSTSEVKMIMSLLDSMPAEHSAFTDRLRTQVVSSSIK